MKKKEIFIFVWDLAHNALGRAFMFYQCLEQHYKVSIVGPLYRLNGDSIWYPLESEVDYKVLKSENFPDLYFELIGLISNLNPDYVIACKTRIPSLLPAILLKKKLNIPIFLDIDDLELSFFNTKDSINLKQLKSHLFDSDFIQPYNKYWTQYASSLSKVFDGIITSNKELQKLYGGIVIGHARDENKFTIDKIVRQEKRKKLGYTESDKVILFAGTPRKHKGIIEIAKSLRNINNNNYKLLIIGTFLDSKVKDELLNINYKNTKYIENQKFKTLSGFLNAADLICLIQDPKNLISQYQVPAKVTDAFSSGTAILTTKVSPIVELIEEGFQIYTIDSTTDLEDKISNILSQLNSNKSYAKKNYDLFKDKLSYKTTLKKLKILFDNTKNEPSVHPEIEEFLTFLQSIFENGANKKKMEFEDNFSGLICNKHEKEIQWFKDTYLHLPKWYVKLGGIFRKLSR